MSRDQVSFEVDGLICDLLFKKIQKPQGLSCCRAINLHDNIYRINLYIKKYDPIIDLERTPIEKSFYCRVDSNRELWFGTAYEQKIHWHQDPVFIPPTRKTTNKNTNHTFTTKEEDFGNTFSLRKK